MRVQNIRTDKMGMFGMGRAFANRFQVGAPVYRPATKMMPVARFPMARTPIFLVAPPTHHCCGFNPTGALISGGVGFVLGGLFGWLTRKNQPAVSYAPQYGMGGFGNYGGFGAQPAANGLQNLQTLYGSKYNIVQNPDGTYTVATKDGQTKLEKATYEQVVSAMKGDNSSVPTTGTENADGAGKPDGTNGTGKPDGTNGTGKPDGTNGTGKPDGTNGTGKPDGTDGTGKPDGTNGTGKPDGTDGTGKPDGTNGTGKPDGTNGTGKPDGTDGTGKPDGTDGTGKPDGTDGTGKPDGTNGTGKTDGTNGTGKPEGTDGTGKTNKNDTYTVKSGDNLWNIAKQHLKEKNGTAPTNAEILAETKRLMEVNGLNYSDSKNTKVLIKPGDVIKYGDSTEEVSEDSNKVPEDNNENGTSAKGNIDDSIYTAENGDFITKGKDGKLQYFDKDGNPMSEKEFKGVHNTINTTEIKNGRYSSQGTRIQSKSGRWAEKNGDTWNFYAKDGTNLKPEYVQQVDPELWQKTWQGVPYKKPEATKTEYKTYDWNSMPRAQWDIEKGWH